MNAKRERRGMGVRHAPQAIPGTAAEIEDARVVERPDGIYLVYTDGRERGPYASFVEAIEDQRLADEEAIEPGETLEEAEAELGVSDWIDPETSAPAEDFVPRIEEH